MPTNANTFNSRVTSEALEAKFRQTFPAQGGAELVQDLFASGVIQPVVDFTAVAEGSALRSDLQSAWGFGTGFDGIVNTTTTMINNTGFWKVDLTFCTEQRAGSAANGLIYITDGLANREIWKFTCPGGTTGQQIQSTQDTFVVFLRTGDSLVGQTDYSSAHLNVWYRQIADVYGNLIQPLGYTSS